MSKYDTFLGTDAAKFEEMTAVDGQRHTRASMETGDVVVNMALAISASDLHKKCHQEAEKAGLRTRKCHHFPGLGCNFGQKMLQHILH